jgi:hypothetical protein
MTLMDLLVDFSMTGGIGPLRCGMSTAEAEGILGPGARIELGQVSGSWEAMTGGAAGGVARSGSGHVAPGGSSAVPMQVLMAVCWSRLPGG